MATFLIVEATTRRIVTKMQGPFRPRALPGQIVVSVADDQYAAVFADDTRLYEWSLQGQLRSNRPRPPTTPGT